MALYRMEIRILGRSGGLRIVESAAYRAGEKLHDERYAMTHDYTAKAAQVRHSEILTPDQAPGWMQLRERLWNVIEAGEKRKDSQLARELLLTLPRELNLGQQITLVRSFLRDEYVSKGMIADFSIHHDTATDGGINPHAHVLLTMRRIDGEKFGKKAREWNPEFTKGQWVKEKDTLIGTRTAWADYVNRALAESGSNARVDHRSHEGRGIYREVEPRLNRAHRYAQTSAQAAARLAEVKRIRFLNTQRAICARSRYQDPLKLALNAEFEARKFYQLDRERAPSIEYHGRLAPPPDIGPDIDR